MTQKTDHYNLLLEDWIPVLWSDGRYSRVGIIEALTQSGRIRQIASSNPMGRIAIVRFLLALLYWCRGNPTEGRESGFHSSFPETWFSKLDANQSLFSLFGDEKRFYQFPPSRNAKRLSANYLIHEIPTGTNKRHFRHSTDGTNGLCPACCAEGLLRLPMFATSGGRGKPPGINGKPPLYVIPQCTSLAATLRLSWLSASNQGLPAWEKTDLELPKTGVVPILVGLTWLPRRVWLDNPEDCSAACISCGRIDRLVRMCTFEGIGSTKTNPEDSGRTWQDPHLILTDIAKGSSRALGVRDALSESDGASGQWAMIAAGILQNQESTDTVYHGIQDSGAEGKHVKAWIVGFSTVQNDKYLEAREYLMPYSLHPSQVPNNIEQLERWQKEWRRIAKQLAGIVGGKLKGNTTISSIRHHIEEKVSVKVPELLGGEEGTWNQAAQEYKTIMVPIAKSLAPGFTSSALLKRIRIAGLKPNMSPKEKETEQPKGSKGGET